jgi:hypothetical protein
MFITLVSVLSIAITGIGATPAPQAPKGTSADPFAPNGALGGLLQLMGNVTYGPAPTGCSKYEILVGESANNRSFMSW